MPSDCCIPNPKLADPYAKFCLEDEIEVLCIIVCADKGSVAVNAKLHGFSRPVPNVYCYMRSFFVYLGLIDYCVE